LAEIDKQPTVGIAVGNLLRFGIEGRLILIVDDELRDRSAAGGPGVLEDGREGRPIDIVARGDIDFGLGAKFLRQDVGENLALNIVRRDRLPDERDRPSRVELGQRRIGAAGEDQNVVRNSDRRSRPRSSPMNRSRR
jgi:hypothetical protein